MFFPKSVLSMFSSKNFIVSGLTFKPLIHFEFIFLYGVRKCSKFILLYMAVQFSQHHWRDYLCHTVYSCLLYQSIHGCMGLPLDFLSCSIGLHFCFRVYYFWLSTSLLVLCVDDFLPLLLVCLHWWDFLVCNFLISRCGLFFFVLKSSL